MQWMLLRQKSSNHMVKEFSKPRTFTNKSKGAQEAHRAIRPTDMSRHTVNIDRDQARLYDLI
jgi:DNA topoisomerase-1